MTKHSGWLFDLYEHPEKGVVLWLVGDDGKPRSFYHRFEMVSYARGSVEELHRLGEFIRSQHSRETVSLKRAQKEDLFDGLLEVMEIGVSSPIVFRNLSREVSKKFQDLAFYDVDIPLTVRFAAALNVFMMGRCEIAAESDGRLIRITALDTPDELDPELPKLRLLSLIPDGNPSHEQPKYLTAKFGKSYMRLSFRQPRELISAVSGICSSFDPDVIHTHYGDGWLLPYLLELSKETGIPFNPNRDPSVPVLRRKEVDFFNYGHAHYRAPQIHLRGRWHVDVENCMTYKQYQLAGAIEQTRLSSLPLQEVARRSPGAAISAMQTLTAMRLGILIPYQRQKAEIAKDFNEYYTSARGGLILQPRPGIFQNVTVLDFSSKMASIMIRYNVSPETVVTIEDERDGFEIPKLGVKILSRPGLIPQTLQPMRDKRLALKRLLKSVDKNDPCYHSVNRRYKVAERLSNFEAIVDALKWLTVVCYGRLRFANSIFGRINSHEAVSYLSRNAILQAKRIAEGMGFSVLHVYIDSLFVWRVDATKEEVQMLADEIEQQTGLPIDVENVYSWFAFLSSRQHPNVTVSNKFYGVVENGKHKIRGVASRRGDTCAFVASLQRGMIEILAKEKDSSKLIALLPEILSFVHQHLDRLKNREVPLEELVITQSLSREPDQFSVLSPLAIVCKQLSANGKTVKRGHLLRFIYTGPAPGVCAWDLPQRPDPRIIDAPRYKELAFRAVFEILQPLGITEKTLKSWLFDKAGYVTPADLKNPAKRLVNQETPILRDIKYLRLN